MNPKIEAMAERIFSAVYECGHRIDASKVVLLHDDNQRGNALGQLHARVEHAVAKEVEPLLADRDALLSALKAAGSVLWMAERYADGGGSHSIEREDFDAAQKEVATALALKR